MCSECFNKKCFSGAATARDANGVRLTHKLYAPNYKLLWMGKKVLLQIAFSSLLIRRWPDDLLCFFHPGSFQQTFWYSPSGTKTGSYPKPDDPFLSVRIFPRMIPSKRIGCISNTDQCNDGAKSCIPVRLPLPGFQQQDQCCLHCFFAFRHNEQNRHQELHSRRSTSSPVSSAKQGMLYFSKTY